MCVSIARRVNGEQQSHCCLTVLCLTLFGVYVCVCECVVGVFMCVFVHVYTHTYTHCSELWQTAHVIRTLTPTLPTLIRSCARLQAILRRHRVRPGACANRQTYQSAIAPVITRYVRTYFRTSIRTHVRAHIRAYRQTARQSDRQTDVDM